MPAYNNPAVTTTALLIGNTVSGAPIHISWYNIANSASAVAYMQFFDAASTAAVTLGTTAPTFWVAVPASGGIVDTSPTTTYPFKNGVVVAATTTPTGASTSALAISCFTK